MESNWMDEQGRAGQKREDEQAEDEEKEKEKKDDQQKWRDRSPLPSPPLLPRSLGPSRTPNERNDGSDSDDRTGTVQ